MGPLLLVQAGVHLVDLSDDRLFDVLRDGDRVEVRGGDITAPARSSPPARSSAPRRCAGRNDEARSEIGDALYAFARNTVEHMVEERELLAGKFELPRFDTVFRDRPVLIVVRGVDHRRDLRALRPYIRDVKPVLVGVDGGADALLEAGLRPHMIVGDMDSATPRALRSGSGASSSTPIPTAARPAARCSSAWTCRTRWSPRRAPARTSRCSSPTRRARS